MNKHIAKNWINIGDWGTEMDEFRLPLSDALAGKNLKLQFNVRNQIIEYIFHDEKSVTWRVLGGFDKGRIEKAGYQAICVASNIFFIDFTIIDRLNFSFSMALDLNTNKATALIATAPDGKKPNSSFTDRLGKGVDLSAMEVEILHANVNPYSTSESIIPHERTSDLIGKRIKYTYGHDRVYEHIYLNEHMFTWHCLVGIEKGLADTEICEYFKIASDLYLFTWREKIMPTFGLVLINLKEMRSNGKTFGLDVNSENYMNFTMGALAEVINEI